MKVLPKELTIGQLYDLAKTICGEYYTPENAIFPAFIIDAVVKINRRQAGDFLVLAMKQIMRDDFEPTFRDFESLEQASLRQQIVAMEKTMQEVGEKYLNNDPVEYVKQITSLAARKVRLQEKLDELLKPENVIMTKALELFGLEEEPRGLPDGGNYRTDILVWAQQRKATMEKFGLEELILMPSNNPNIILVCIEHNDEFEAVTTLPVHGENSTFFKDVSALVGKPHATNGVNNVWKYEGKAKMVNLNRTKE